jgi:hypothetical protein
LDVDRSFAASRDGARDSGVDVEVEVDGGVRRLRIASLPFRSTPCDNVKVDVNVFPVHQEISTQSTAYVPS